MSEKKPKPHTNLVWAAPTLPEMREMLSTLYYEVDNNGGAKTRLGSQAYETYKMMAWLVDEYLFGPSQTLPDPLAAAGGNPA